jgi:hypothetical protein
MSVKILSLGTVSASVTSGIAMTGGTNATPIVATITAGHNLKSGDRVHISGVTGLTAMNGEWELKFLSATTAQLVGSKGNGTYGGTPVVNVICDKTPFLPGHSVMAHFQNGSTALSAGTFEVEGHPGTESSPGVLSTSAWVKATITDQHPDSPPFGTGSTYVGALPNINNSPVEVKLYKYMRATVKSALTGTATVKLVA